MPTKNFKDFCPGSLLEGRAKILKNFVWHFGRNDDLNRRRAGNNLEKVTYSRITVGPGKFVKKNKRRA